MDLTYDSVNQKFVDELIQSELIETQLLNSELLNPEQLETRMAQTFAQKLNLKPGQVLALVNPPKAIPEALAAQLPENPLAAGGAGQAEAVLVFLTKQEDSAALAGIYANLKTGGLAWAAYPKGGAKVPTDLNRDILWKLVEPTGWRAVRMVALDETWSAMRFRQESASS